MFGAWRNERRLIGRFNDESSRRKDVRPTSAPSYGGGSVHQKRNAERAVLDPASRWITWGGEAGGGQKIEGSCSSLRLSYWGRIASPAPGHSLGDPAWYTRIRPPRCAGGSPSEVGGGPHSVPSGSHSTAQRGMGGTAACPRPRGPGPRRSRLGGLQAPL